MNILFQGDSITDCGRCHETTAANTSLGAGYAALSAGRLLASHPDKNFQFFNRGISGNRIVDLYARWKIDGINLKPDVISILIGVNDTWHEFGSKNGVEPARFEKIYRMLLDLTRQHLPDVRLIICEPFVLPCGVVNHDWVSEMNERRGITEKLAYDYNAAYINFQELFNKAAQKGSLDFWLRDGVHPTLAGHTIMSDEWVKTFYPLMNVH